MTAIGFPGFVMARGFGLDTALAAAVFLTGDTALETGVCVFDLAGRIVPDFDSAGFTALFFAAADFTSGLSKVLAAVFNEPETADFLAAALEAAGFFWVTRFSIRIPLFHSKTLRFQMTLF
jgi:hypothetical protein